MKVVAGNSIYIIEGDFGNKRFLLDGCNTRIIKNGKILYEGPYHEGNRDTVDMKDRCGTITGTKYYPDHSNSYPHYDRGEWKDGKKHGNITRVKGSYTGYEVWKNNVYRGHWSGLAGKVGHGVGYFISKEDSERYAREDAYRARQEAEEARRREQQHRQENHYNPPSCDIDKLPWHNSTQFICKDGPRDDSTVTCFHEERSVVCVTSGIRERSYVDIRDAAMKVCGCK
ncbi:MAG: hypothetical protein HQK83_20020 [Fibrobacteria bacterium]|nr:hypothetical protein [Fibrobacteria bacterium]